jgi:hypothetical protein
MGLVPAACDRVGETAGGAARDVRRDHGVSLCRGGLAPTASLIRPPPVGVTLPWSAVSLGTAGGVAEEGPARLEVAAPALANGRDDAEEGGVDTVIIGVDPHESGGSSSAVGASFALELV